jgi:hypothetical protein
MKQNELAQELTLASNLELVKFGFNSDPTSKKYKGEEDPTRECKCLCA